MNIEHLTYREAKWWILNNWEFIEKKSVHSYINSDAEDEYEVTTIGYSCEHHVEEVNKLLKEIYYGNKESNDI